jgi:uncharacterized membrane protein
MIEEKIDRKRKIGFALAFVALCAGMILNRFDIGQKPYLGFATLGNWIIFMGLVLLFVPLVSVVVRRKKVMDERMLAISMQADRIVFLALIALAFIIMIADGIEPIDIPLGLFMAYVVNAMMLVYFISYHAMLRYG